MEVKNPRDQQKEPIKPQNVFRPKEFGLSEGKPINPPSRFAPPSFVPQVAKSSGLIGRTIYYVSEEDKSVEGLVLDYFYHDSEYAPSREITLLVERDNSLELVRMHKIKLTKPEPTKG